MDVSTYRLSAAHLLRLAGTLVIGLGVLWIIGTLVDIPGPLRAVLAGLTIVVLLTLMWVAVRPPRILTLDEVGYKVRWVRGAGRSSAAWREVEGVTNRRAGAVEVMVFELRDGTSTTLPLTLLGPAHLAAQREVHERLNTAHGYRRLDQP